MAEIYKAMVNIANEVQTSSATHPRCVLQMRKIFDANPFGKFWDDFIRIISQVLLSDYKAKSDCVNRTISFISIFCTSMEKRNVGEDESIVETQLLTSTFKLLLKVQCNRNDNVRFHACLLVNKILDNLVGAELSLEVWDNIQAAMLERAQDTRVGIRIQALTALYSLQDPTNADCPVMSEYVARIKNDSNRCVRKLCVEKVALRRDVIPVLLQHSLDVHEQVRLAVYSRAVQFPRHFKIIQRQALIRNGIHGDSEAVANYIKQHLIPSWLHHWNDNYLELGKALRLDGDFKDLEESTEVIEYVLKSLISTNPRSEILQVLELDENKLVQSTLEFETILYWRVLLQVLKEIDEYEAAEMMPEFMNFCDYIQRYNDSKKEAELDGLDYLQYQFVLNQMFVIVGIYDLSDVKCRQHLNELISGIIKNSTLQPEVLQTIIDCLNYTLPCVDEKIRFVVEQMSEILYHTPEDNNDYLDNFELAQKKVKLFTLQKDQEDAIKERDFLRAGELDKEIDEVKTVINISREAFENAANAEVTKKTDEPTLKKYLDVCIALLSCPKIRVLNSMLRTLKDDTIHNLLMHESEIIRRAALRCYGLLCILDEQTAKVGVHLFCASIEAYKNGLAKDVPNVLTAISTVVDLIRLFGLDLMANPHCADNNLHDASFDEQEEALLSGGSSLTTIIQILVDFMQDENIEVQEKAGTGLCLLLLDGRIQSPSVVSRLIIKWASPATDGGDSILVQLIGFMLERLPRCPEASTQIEKSVIPTVKTIFKAPKNSPLAEINQSNLMKFFIALCTSCPDHETVHLNLAYTLCNEILDHPKKSYNLFFSKMLLMLSFSGCDKSSILDLRGLCDEIRDEVSDRHVISNIIKFITMLNKSLTMSRISVIVEGSDDSSIENKGDN